MSDKQENLGAVTFWVQGSGRIQVEVPAEKGEKVRGHRSPSDQETGHPHSHSTWRLWMIFFSFWQSESPETSVPTRIVTEFKLSLLLVNRLHLHLANESRLGPPTRHGCQRTTRAGNREPRPHHWRNTLKVRGSICFYECHNEYFLKTLFSFSVSYLFICRLTQWYTTRFTAERYICRLCAIKEKYLLWDVCWVSSRLFIISVVPPWSQ